MILLEMRKLSGLWLNPLFGQSIIHSYTKFSVNSSCLYQVRIGLLFLLSVCTAINSKFNLLFLLGREG